MFEHCRTVRSICQDAAPNYWHRRQGSEPKPLCGGLMLSLDMTQAFDRLPRHALAAGLHRLAPDSALASMMLHWLTGVRYHIRHRGHQTVVQTSRSVRQGCKASPLEWTVFLCELFQHLDHAMSQYELEWALHHLITC